MNITSNGITKDCTEWGCENVAECEHGCLGFKVILTVKKDFEDELDEPDDFRTKKEQQDDLGDYLRDRSMDAQHELCEHDCGAR